MSGLLAPQAEITIEIANQEGESMISAEENAKTREFLMENWNLGPEKTAQPNMDYWRTLSKVWRIAPEQAKRNLCANCEYFNDSPDMLAKMESVPEDQFDKDGGGRGWCSKFKFICHHQRTCRAWERAEQTESEIETYESGEESDMEE
jgi:hypothetical protein